MQRCALSLLQRLAQQLPELPGVPIPVHRLGRGTSGAIADRQLGMLCCMAASGAGPKMLGQTVFAQQMIFTAVLRACKSFGQHCCPARGADRVAQTSAPTNTGPHPVFGRPSVAGLACTQGCCSAQPAQRLERGSAQPLQAKAPRIRRQMVLRGQSKSSIWPSLTAGPLRRLASSKLPSVASSTACEAVCMRPARVGSRARAAGPSCGAIMPERRSWRLSSAQASFSSCLWSALRCHPSS